MAVLPGGSLAEDFQYSVTVDQDGRMESYTVVEQVTLLGDAIDRYGNSNLSALHRRSCGTCAFYMHRTPLSSHGHIDPRLKAWISVVESSAVFGCEAWRITSHLMQEMQTWELQHFRNAFRLKHRKVEGRAIHSKRVAVTLRS